MYEIGAYSCFLGSSPVGDNDLWHHHIWGFFKKIFSFLSTPSPRLPTSSKALLARSEAHSAVEGIIRVPRSNLALRMHTFFWYDIFRNVSLRGILLRGGRITPNWFFLLLFFVEKKTTYFARKRLSYSYIYIFLMI